jgi:polysaccharide chain length determinant protein (PEP-CTERM system associated)
MRLQPDLLLKLIVNEAFQSRRLVVALFVVIMLGMLVVGLVWPKGYSAATTILVDEKNIIRPLMEGAAVATDVADRARMAREVIYGRRIMDQIMNDSGWLKGDPAPEEREQIMKKLIKQTAITNLGRNIIKIEYRDDDAERAYLTTKRYAELFISESLTAKARESEAAFAFIDKQVQEYHDKLARAEEALKEFRSANVDARPGSDVDVSARLGELQTRIEQSTQELKDKEVKKTSLERQLSGEAEVASVISREGQYRARIAELQSQLETLRLNYHETYPDIVRIRHQIGDLNDAIAAENRRRQAAKASGHVTIDETVINNPMYQQLRRDLSDTQVQIDTLTARIGEARRQMQATVERGKRVHGGEATLAELTRDYTVNRDIYQDLLKRRENARVSMNLDRDNQGLSFKVQEPATLPLHPSGLRFWHFIALGLVLGLGVPFALLYAKLYLDPRVRIAHAAADKHSAPLLGVVPHLWLPSETESMRREVEWLTTLVMLTLVVVAAGTVLRLIKVV